MPSLPYGCKSTLSLFMPRARLLTFELYGYVHLSNHAVLSYSQYKEVVGCPSSSRRNARYTTRAAK
jgi:hypothetical protein